MLVSTFLMLIWLSPWRRARLFAYLDPWNEDNAYGSAYQPVSYTHLDVYKRQVPSYSAMGGRIAEDHQGVGCPCCCIEDGA